MSLIYANEAAFPSCTIAPDDCSSSVYVFLELLTSSVVFLWISNVKACY